MNGHFIFYLKKVAQKIQEPKTDIKKNKKQKLVRIETDVHPKQTKEKKEKKRKGETRSLKQC